MVLTRSCWARLLEVDKEFTRRGERLSRKKVQDAFSVSEHDARFLVDALKHKHIISLSPDGFKPEEGDRELILTDIHIPFQDKSALEAALEYGDRFRPTIITLLGDTIDFYQISRFIKSPEKRSVSSEMGEVKGFLAHLRERFPQARIIFYEGNHEARCDAYLMSQAKEIYDLVNDLVEIKLGFDESNVEFIREPFRIGKLWHLHGHEKGGGAYNPEYVTNVVFNFVLDSFVCGHFHRGQDKVFKRIDRTIFMGMAVGYLAGDMDYARLNKWNQGFATVVYSGKGKFRARGHKIFNGEIF